MADNLISNGREEAADVSIQRIEAGRTLLAHVRAGAEPGRIA